MTSTLEAFEKIARNTSRVSSWAEAEEQEAQSHPFDERNIHPEIAGVSLRLFDDGHYSQATFEAFKHLDNIVNKLSNIKESGHKLMMAAFSETSPKIMLTALSNASEKDEQMGYKFIFAGAMSAIRNPRGHEILTDPIDLCLDHLSFASVLLRRLEGKVK